MNMMRSKIKNMLLGKPTNESNILLESPEFQNLSEGKRAEIKIVLDNMPKDQIEQARTAVVQALKNLFGQEPESIDSLMAQAGIKPLLGEVEEEPNPEELEPEEFPEPDPEELAPEEPEQDELEGSEILDKFMEQEEIYTFEGATGSRNLETIINALGYSGSGWTSRIEEFLSDNPGLQEVIIEWVGETIDKVPEWKENLLAELAEEE